MKYTNPFKILLFIYLFFIIGLVVLTIPQYPGNEFLYLTFTFLINFYLILSFLKSKIFFETFFSTFLWLGLWLKISVRLSFLNGNYHEPTGNFSGSALHYDKAMTTIIIALVPLILVSLLRRLFYNYTTKKPKYIYSFFNLKKLYNQHRYKCLGSLMLLSIFIAITNIIFNIYQRGIIPNSAVPFFIYGIYAWLVTFGLSTFFSFFLQFDLSLKKSPYLSTIFFIIESFLSSTSLLSRAMIMNSSAGLFGALNFFYYKKIYPHLMYIVSGSIILFLLFILSMHSVTTIRKFMFNQNYDLSGESRMGEFKSTKKTTTILLLDRWVGAEAVFAVTSFPQKGIHLFHEAFAEKLRAGRLSLYDRTFIESSYKDVDFSRNNFISIPGPIAFLAYADDFLIIFAGMFILSLVGTFYDLFFFSFSDSSLVTTALLSQTVAYRFTHIGYAIRQSHQFFGTIIVTMLILVIIDKALGLYYGKVKMK